VPAQQTAEGIAKTAGMIAKMRTAARPYLCFNQLLTLPATLFSPKVLIFQAFFAIQAEFFSFFFERKQKGPR